MLVAFILMSLTNIPANLLSLGAASSSSRYSATISTSCGGLPARSSMFSMPPRAPRTDRSTKNRRCRRSSSRSIAPRRPDTASTLVTSPTRFRPGSAVRPSQVFIRDRQYDAPVRFPEAARNNPEAIGNLMLTSTTGGQIPLSRVARIRLQSGDGGLSGMLGLPADRVEQQRPAGDRFAMLVGVGEADEQVPPSSARKRADDHAFFFKPSRIASGMIGICRMRTPTAL
jgi:hypothetical protein